VTLTCLAVRLSQRHQTKEIVLWEPIAASMLGQVGH
jgi:hypothetical protein